MNNVSSDARHLPKEPISRPQRYPDPVVDAGRPIPD